MLASAPLLKLAGFLMAHAFDIIAELPEGQLYVPQAFCETSAGVRELVVFEAAEQAEAIQNGKTFLASPPARFDRCVFARDGQVRTSAGYVDVLNVTLWQREGGEEAILSQPYLPPFKGGFQLLGPERFIRQGSIEPPRGQTAEDRLVAAGAMEHPHARTLWPIWDAHRRAVTANFPF